MSPSRTLQPSPSALDAFKAPPLQLQNPRTQDVFQSIVKGRKSWKTLRGGEVVWPPELEAALIEGLENYQPDDSRETRLLGRFPMRNRFISDWIFEKTGKRRTAKQVGSRLQQLRDTCGGKRLLNLLSPTRRPCRTPSQSPEYQHKDGHLAFPPPLRYESESSSDSSASAPPTPTEAHATLQSLLYRGVEPRVEDTPETIVYIDLLPEDSQAADALTASWSSTAEAAEEQRLWAERGYKVVNASPDARHLRDIDPTVTLLSKQPTSAQSYFTVHTDDGVVYSEATSLELVDQSLASPTSDGSLLYKTSLVPGYWDVIARSADASQYVIIQRVVQDAASSSSSSSTIFSAMYRFNYLGTSHSQSQSQQQQHQLHASFSVATGIIPMDQSMHQHQHHQHQHHQQQKQEFSFDDPMLHITDDSFSLSDMMSFGTSKTPYYDINPYTTMRPDWATSSPAESVYPSPIDCSRPMSVVMSGSDHLLSSASSYSVEDVPNYAL